MSLTQPQIDSRSIEILLIDAFYRAKRVPLGDGDLWLPIVESSRDAELFKWVQSVGFSSRPIEIDGKKWQVASRSGLQHHLRFSPESVRKRKKSPFEMVAEDYWFQRMVVYELPPPPPPQIIRRIRGPQHEIFETCFTRLQGKAHPQEDGASFIPWPP